MKLTKTLTLKRSNYPLSQIVVKKAMLDADIRMTALARRFGVNPATISLTIAGKTRNLAIQQAIASTLKLPLESLWDMSPHKTRKRTRKPAAPSPSVRPSTETGAPAPSLAASAAQE